MQAVRLRHHELVLRLDARLEQAVDEIMQVERDRGEEVDRGGRETMEAIREIEKQIEVIAKEVAVHQENNSSTRERARFVQRYPMMVKEAEEVIGFIKGLRHID